MMFYNYSVQDKIELMVNIHYIKIITDRFTNLLFPGYNLLTAHTDTDFRSVCSMSVLTRADIHTGVHTA